MNEHIGVVIIATNEERDLPACLDSVRSLRCPILLVDGGSRDGTRDIARKAGARVLERPFDDFARQRRYALERASTPWILQLDADERVSPGLAREIARVMGAKTPRYGAYRIPFQVSFMGRRMRFSGLGTQKVLRLFRKDAVELRGDRSVHEAYRVTAPRIGDLRHPIFHHPYADLAEYAAKCELYTDLAARDFAANGGKLSWRHDWIPAWEFFQRFILRLGFLDGFPGLLWAVLSAYHSKVRYGKIRRLLKNDPKAQPEL